MKKIRFLYCLMAVVLCIGFVSCSSDDDENGGGLELEGKPVKSINRTPNVVEDCDWTFTYANNKLVTGVRQLRYHNKFDAPEAYSIDYEKNTLMEKVNEDDGSQSTEVRTFTLNEKGYISSITANYYGIDNIPYTYTTNYTYSSDGYLTQIEGIYSNDDKHNITKFTYANGNIIRVENSWFYADLTYHTYENKNGISPEFMSDTMELSGHEILHYAGLLGRPTKNLVKSVIIGSSYSSIGTRNFTYQFDKDGNVLNCQYNCEDGNITTTYGY